MNEKHIHSELLSSLRPQPGKVVLHFQRRRMMKNRMILTPFFLDGPVPGLKELVGEDWWVNEPNITADKPQERMIELYRPLAKAVKRAVESGERPVSIAGDCCTTIGVLAGLQQGGLEPTLLWFDAHGDFNSWETSPSGFLGGMPLAMIVGRGELTMGNGVGQAVLPENQVILTDGRDLDPEEKVAVEGSAVRHLPDVMMLLDKPVPAGPIYVHFDVDVINPVDAPAMNYLAAGGPTVSDLGRVFDTLAESRQVAAVSVSSWNPEMDEDGRSRTAVMGLLERLLR
jgi:arginase